MSLPSRSATLIRYGDRPAVERLVTVREAARVLGIGRQLLYRAAEDGALAIYDPSPGGWSRVRLSDVAAWIESTRRLPRAER